MLANAYFENKMEQILDVSKRRCEALNRASIPYRIVGGLAVFLHVDHVDPLKARLTRDVDVAVERSQLAAAEKAPVPYGFEHRHAAADVRGRRSTRSAQRGSHRLAGEKVLSDHWEQVLSRSQLRCPKGFITPVADLVQTELTSFRLKDTVHLPDLDSACLISPEIE